MSAPDDRPYVDHPLERGLPPSWVSAWGDSKYGPWVGFEVGGVEQRLYWIRPGTFKMGSPATEPGRIDNEAQHEATLTRGFWMAETPVTQGLWEAVMGANPSRFVDPRRPVEQVSWEEVQEFIVRLNEKQPGLSMRLPTEAEWEYCCRAGTETATHAGPIEILGTCNAPVLDRIAWYSGNSGNDYDLEVHEDSKDWPEKQYPHDKAGTRRVKTRRPNAWGLHDTLGNVWEWCHDFYGPYGDGPGIDPIGSHEGALRVRRGGSWINVAQDVRAAVRGRDGPSDRDSGIGFRLSRDHGAPSR